MKKSIQIIPAKTTFALLLFIIISKTTVAQLTEIKYDAPVKIETVILKFPDINSIKVYTAVQTALSGIYGVSVRGRCPDTPYLFLNVDRRYFPQNDDVLKKITDANFVFEVVPEKYATKQNGICPEYEIAK